MKLSLQSVYRCLQPQEIDLPDFTVITGVNGSGKTQLLRVIESGLASLDGKQERGNAKYFHNRDLDPKPSGGFSSRGIKVQRAGAYLAVVQYKDIVAKQPKLTWDDFCDQKDISGSIRTYVKSTAIRTGKSEQDLEDRDFQAETLFVEQSADNPFDQNLSSVFWRYWQIETSNSHALAELTQGRTTINQPMSNVDFLARYGPPPWQKVNSIFAEWGIDYHYDRPEGEIFSHEQPAIVPRHNASGAEVTYESFSSGEKILVSMLLALYNLNSGISFPDIILLDEPDASLHPSMSKRLIALIADTFVAEFRKKVILTTHSPATVALSPSESIYVLSRTTRKLEKASKIIALERDRVILKRILRL